MVGSSKSTELTEHPVFGYADDHQVFKSFDPNSQTPVLTTQLSECFLTIQRWMDYYYLQLNASKTQIIVVGPPRITKKIVISGALLTPSTCIRFVTHVKNLGIHMDSSLSFSKQITEMKRKSFVTIRNLCKIRHLLSEEQLKTVMNSLVVSCLDYCNALFVGVSDKHIHQIQLIQNAAAKCIFKKYKHDHLEDDLSRLHWLTVDKRIVFKLMLLVFKSLIGSAPMYLQDLLSFNPHGHNLNLKVPIVKGVQGRRAFSFMGPTVWNNLPLKVKSCTEIEAFKKILKTYLFELSSYELQKLMC